jgi:amino acid transporter
MTGPAPSTLRRGVGFHTALATSLGIVVASLTIISLNQGYGLAGSRFTWALFIAYGIMVCNVLSFAELSALIPRASGISSYTLPALGPFMAIVATLSGYVLVNLLAGGAEVLVGGFVLHDVLGVEASARTIAMIAIAALTVVNLLGIKVYGEVQIVLAYFMIGSLTLIGAIGVAEPATVTTMTTTPPDSVGLLSLVSLAIWLYIGVDYVCPLAEEMKNPQRNVPLAMLSALTIILVSSLLFGLAGLQHVSPQVLVESRTPHVTTAQAVLGPSGGYWVAFISIAASGSTLNTIIAAIPRLLFGLARQGAAPAVFARLHPRYRTPYVGILAVGGVLLATVALGLSSKEGIVIFILAATFSYLITYATAHIDVMVLRARYPEAKRPFRSPWFPLPQVVGLVGVIYLLMHISPEPSMTADIYLLAGGMLALTALYAALWIRFRMKRRLFTPEPLTKEVPAVPDEANRDG